jgi:hypothetical protein
MKRTIREARLHYPFRGLLWHGIVGWKKYVDNKFHYRLFGVKSKVFPAFCQYPIWKHRPDRDRMASPYLFVSMLKTGFPCSTTKSPTATAT